MNLRHLRPRPARCIGVLIVLLAIIIAISCHTAHQALVASTSEVSTISLEKEGFSRLKQQPDNNSPTIVKTVTPVEETVVSENWLPETEIYAPTVYTAVASYTSDGTISDYEKQMMAQLLYGEANSVASEAERAMVVWTILNRYDSGAFGDSVSEIVSAPMQFTGYDSSNPVTDANLSLVEDVVDRWERENAGEENVGRTLPEEYCYFVADSDPSAGEWHNAFYAYEYGNQGEKVWYDYENPSENPY